MSKIDSHDIEEILLFDSTFKVSYDDEITGKANSIMMTNSGRNLVVTAKDKIEQMIWVKAIDEAFKTSEWSTRAVKRFGSFAPARLNNECRSFSDAEEYFSAVQDALKEAKEVVFITDWWLSPKLYLKRPIASDPKHRNESSRLDLILKEIANRGVMVYVLMFKEITLAVGLNSEYSKKELMNASDNIRVIRHPREVVFSTARDFINLWSHHEKMVVIDYKTVFMGGIDLCFGRMDTHEHPLTDLPNAKGEVFFPGQDYNNVRIADFIKVEDPELCLLDRDSQPRMPWHDVAVMLKGQVVKDFVIHFVQYWNHAMIDTSGISNKGKLLYPVYNENRTLMLTSEQLKYANGGLNSQEAEPHLEEEQKNFNRTSILLVDNDCPIKDPKKQSEFQEYCELRRGQVKDAVVNDKNLLEEYLARWLGAKMLNECVSLSQVRAAKGAGLYPALQMEHRTCKAQLLRSVSSWSIGFPTDMVENSIHKAYIHHIGQARNFIYIENQYFMSSYDTIDCPLKNKVAEALFNRILIAHLNNENFKVFIVIPLYPGTSSQHP
eukprot:TRINITY_DN2082_c0_g1_i22.p1 TRINITY_DN2082_c0_g1~~TRINITY_DN2082_c0_g1_i22.p1  ORF type:complete len:550 (-),score=135.98 TRINITY_DN2082_c0_g1_i22:848-2497(-)